MAKASAERTYPSNGLDRLIDTVTKSGFNDKDAKEETVIPYAPSEARVVTTVMPEAKCPAACLNVCPDRGSPATDL